MNKLAIGAILFLVASLKVSASDVSEEVRQLLQSNQLSAAKEKVLECAVNGDADCQALLAHMVEVGIGFQKDEKKAKLLYEKAYANGHQGAAAHVLRLTRDVVSEERDVTASILRSQTNPTAVTNSFHCPAESHYFDDGHQVATIDCGFKVEFVVMGAEGRTAQIAIKVINGTHERIELDPEDISVTVNGDAGQILDTKEAIAVVSSGSTFKRIIAGIASGVAAYGAGTTGRKQTYGSFNALGSGGEYLHGTYTESTVDNHARQQAIDSAADSGAAMQNKIDTEVNARKSGIEATYLRRTTLFPGDEQTSGLLLSALKKIKAGDVVRIEFNISNKIAILSATAP